MIELSVNLNKFALLRNSRGGNVPDVLAAARVAIEHGAYGITVHPRPDLRHIRPADVYALATMLRRDYPGIEFNIEGNPIAPANDRGYPGFAALIARTRPDQCTLVPDGDAQLTSDHGWDMARDAQRLAPIIDTLRQSGARVCLFMDAQLTAAQTAAAMTTVSAVGAERIELYTGPFAADLGSGVAEDVALAPYLDAAAAATRAGLGVNAGHDLNLDNLPVFARIPGILEVSIGHALVDDALQVGFATAVARYVGVLRKAARRATTAPFAAPSP